MLGADGPFDQNKVQYIDLTIKNIFQKYNSIKRYFDREIFRLRDISIEIFSFYFLQLRYNKDI